MSGRGSSFRQSSANSLADQRCEEAHGNLLPWITTCSVNGVPLEDIQINFGPDDAYYAYETVRRHVQSKLIIDLQDCLNVRPEELPAHVSMGVDGAWSVLWADGTHQHHIMPNTYTTLCALMERPGLPRLKVRLSFLCSEICHPDLKMSTIREGYS